VLTPTRTVAEAPPVVVLPPAPPPPQPTPVAAAQEAPTQHPTEHKGDDVADETEDVAGIGPLDSSVLAIIAGGLLALATVLPWAAGAGRHAAFPSGLSLRAGTIAFACGGALVFAALIRIAARGRRSLAFLRAIGLLAAAVALGVFVYQVVASPGVLTLVFRHGLYADLGSGLWLVPVGAAFGFLAAIRAGWQLRDLLFDTRLDVPPGVL
jgi:hypothetical protein